MSNGHVHLYGLAALLCVCTVMSQNGSNTNITLVHTTSPPNVTTDNIQQTTNNSKAGTPTEISTDYNEYQSNFYLTTSINPDNDSVAATTDDGEDVTSSADSETSEVSGHQTTVAVIIHTSTTQTSKTTEEKSSYRSSAGVVFLVLILIIIIALAVLLYILWKKGRTYSFDLSQAGNDHETPLRSMEHGGTFEHTNKELPPLDFGQEEKSCETNPTANGCAAEADKQAPPSEHQNVPEEDSYMSDTSGTPPPKKVEFSLDLDLITDDFEVVDLPSADTSNQQQNENNNNVTNSGNDSLSIFTEINLDEPQ